MTEPLAQPTPGQSGLARAGCSSWAAFSARGEILGARGRRSHRAVAPLRAGRPCEMAPYEVLARGHVRRPGPLPDGSPPHRVEPLLQRDRHRRRAGFGMGWTALTPTPTSPAGDIRLRPEQGPAVRLVDISGMPAAGVAVASRAWFSRRQGYLGRRLALGEFGPAPGAPRLAGPVPDRRPGAARLQGSAAT